MKTKSLYLLLALFLITPVLQSCGSSKRGCKKMRKYRTYSFGDNQQETQTYRLGQIDYPFYIYQPLNLINHENTH